MDKKEVWVFIILLLTIFFLCSNISYRNNLIEEQKEKITNLQIELDNQKEITYQLQLEQKRGALDE